MCRLCVFLLIIVSIISQTRAACKISEDTCTIFWEISYRLTMMKDYELVYPADGNIYWYNITDPGNADPVNVDTVMTADGWYTNPRIVTVVNSTMPGPTITAYQGQRLVIHVINNLKDAGITIHWHGLTQFGTPWMDGVPFIAQCPIQPGQSFRYDFTLTPEHDNPGTYWYHSHVDSQRTNGLYGAIIIKRKSEIIEDKVIQVTEWNHDFQSGASLLGAFSWSFKQKAELNSTRSLDGNNNGLHFHSALINGRGRFTDPNTGENNMAPLTVFSVSKGVKYRFRVIGVGNIFSFRVSIDNHQLNVIAADGYEITPIVAESVVVNPGERIDFEMTANQDVDNYWIRAEALERGNPLTGEAVLRYDDADEQDPATSQSNCTQDNPCVIINCPFKKYPYEDNSRICTNFDTIQSQRTTDPAPLNTTGQFKEHFLNFGFPDGSASINGRIFLPPNVNLLTQQNQWSSPCDAQECGEDKVCTCTHALNIENGDTIQIVFTNMGSGRGWSHPIHMHGHTYYVLKIGYGEFNTSTGIIGPDNKDINCQSKYCNNATWTNPDWRNGNVPGLELDRPPRKDTIIVPTGGYVVLRIRADNPGIWYMHCHIEDHQLLGMVMVLNETTANPNQHPKPPTDLPVCNSFPQKGAVVVETPVTGALSDTNDFDDLVTTSHYNVLLGLLATLIVLVVLLAVCIGVTICHVARKRPHNTGVEQTEMRAVT